MSYAANLETFDLQDVACMCVTMVGVKLAVTSASPHNVPQGQGGFNYLAAAAVVASNIAFSTRSVALGRIRKSLDGRGEGVNGREVFYRITHQGTVLLTPVVIGWGGWKILTEGWGLLGGNEGGGRGGLIGGAGGVLGGFLYNPMLAALNISLWLVYNSSSTNLLTVLPPTTHALLNVLRRLVIIVGTTWWFNVDMGVKGWAGIVVAVGGMAAFKVGRAGGKRMVRGKKVWL